MVGGAKTFIQTAIQTLRLVSNAMRSNWQTTDIKNKRAAANAVAALNRPTPVAQSPTQVVVPDGARKEAVTALLDAVVETKASATKQSSKPNVSNNADVGGMVIFTALPVVPNLDSISASLQGQLSKLIQDAQSLEKQVQSAEMAAFNEQRIRTAITATSKKLDAAQFQQFKNTLLANLASDKVIGTIITNTLNEIIAEREQTLEAQGTFSLTSIAQNILTTRADQEQKAEAIKQDMYNLVQSIFISKGNTNELTVMLQAASKDLESKIAKFDSLSAEATSLETLKGLKAGILAETRNTLNSLNKLMVQLTGTLDSINQSLATSTFDPGASYDSLVALKASVEANIKGFQNNISALQVYIGRIDLDASLSAKNAAVAEKGVTIAEVTASVGAALNSPAGAVAMLTQAQTQYAAANAALGTAGAALISATDGSEGPTLPALTEARGDKPVKPEATADSILKDLEVEGGALAVSISDTSSIQDIMNSSIGLFEQLESAKNAAYIEIHGPDGLIAKRDALNNIISQLRALSANTATSDGDRARVLDQLNTLLGGMGFPPVPDSSKLDNALLALAELNAGIVKTEGLRRQAIQGMEGLSLLIMKDTQTLLDAQYTLEQKMLENEKNTLNASEPSKSLDTSGVSKADNMVKFYEDQRDAAFKALEVNVASLRGAINNLGLADSATKLRLMADVARETVTVNGAAQLSAANAAVATGTAVVTEATAETKTREAQMKDAEAAMRSAEVDFQVTQGLISGLLNNVLPSLVSLRAELFKLNNKTFSYMTNTRLFSESTAMFMRSSADVMKLYMGQAKIGLGIKSTALSLAAETSKTEAESSLANIKDAGKSSDILNAKIDALKADLKKNNLTDTSIVDTVTKLSEIQNEALENLETANEEYLALSTNLSLSATNLSDAKGKLDAAIKKQQEAIDTILRLGDLRERLRESIVERNTTDESLERYIQMGESHKEAMSVSKNAKDLAALNAATPEINKMEMSILNELKGLRDAANALEKAESAYTADLIALYNKSDKKSQDDYVAAALNDFFTDMGTTYTDMETAKAKLQAKINELLAENENFLVWGGRLRELQRILDGARGFNRDMLLRQADIAKLLGISNALKAEQEAAASAAEIARLEATQEASDNAILDNMKDMIRELKNSLENDSISRHRRLLVEQQIRRLENELKEAGAYLKLLNGAAMLQLLQTRRAALEAAINAENAKITPNTAILNTMLAEQKALKERIDAINADMSRIEAELAAHKAAVLEAQNKNSLLEQFKQDLKPPVNINYSALFGKVGLGILALGGLGVFIPPMLTNLFGQGECLQGKAAAYLEAKLDQAKYKTMETVGPLVAPTSVGKLGFKAGQAWAKVNNQAGTQGSMGTQYLPQGLEEVVEEEEPGEEEEEEERSEEEDEEDGEVEELAEGSASNDDPTGVNSSGNAQQGGQVADLPQSRELNNDVYKEDANEGEEAEAKPEEEGEEAETEDEEEGEEAETEAEEEEEDEGVSLVSLPTEIPTLGDSIGAVNKTPSAKDMEMPKYAINHMRNKFLTKSIDWLKCFEEELMKSLGPDWRDGFKKGAATPQTTNIPQKQLIGNAPTIEAPPPEEEVVEEEEEDEEEEVEEDEEEPDSEEDSNALQKRTTKPNTDDDEEEVYN